MRRMSRGGGYCGDRQEEEVRADVSPPARISQFQMSHMLWDLLILLLVIVYYEGVRIRKIKQKARLAIAAWQLAYDDEKRKNGS